MLARSGVQGEASTRASDPRVGYDQLLALLDNTSAVIYMRDVDGRYMLVNREYERLFNINRGDIIGLTDHDIFPIEIAADFRANDLKALSGGVPVQIEETAPAPDGPHTYVTVKFPLIDQDGAAYAVCGISTDITARKRAEEEVRVLNEELEQRVRLRTRELEARTRELDAFAYSVSHDLRAPLRSLHGFSQILIEDYGDVLEGEARSYLDRLQANVNRMSQLIDDLLRLSRATRAELHHTSLDLVQVASAIVDELRANEPGRRVTVETSDSFLIDGDERLLRLALWNLLSNAWKFTTGRTEPRILIGARAQDDGPVFFIQDNGAGFDPRYAERMFEPFQRLHASTEFEGSGIGLAIVRRVIQRHGGRIWAESTPDQGATFYLTFPTFGENP